MSSDSDSDSFGSITVAADLVPDSTTELELSEKATDYALVLAREHGGVQGEILPHSPSTIAAASVYLAGILVNEKRTQAEVSDVTGVSRMSIREAYTEIMDREGLNETGARFSHPDLEGF